VDAASSAVAAAAKGDAAKAYLLVDRAGGGRHSPGMARKLADEAWRPPGIEQSVFERQKLRSNAKRSQVYLGPEGSFCGNADTVYGNLNATE
jgi:hypothetical protein